MRENGHFVVCCHFGPISLPCVASSPIPHLPTPLLTPFLFVNLISAVRSLFILTYILKKETMKDNRIVFVFSADNRMVDLSLH